MQIPELATRLIAGERPKVRHVDAERMLLQSLNYERINEEPVSGMIYYRHPRLPDEWLRLRQRGTSDGMYPDYIDTLAGHLTKVQTAGGFDDPKTDRS